MKQPYKIILNNLSWCAKPTNKTIHELVNAVPDIKISGFGYSEFYKLYYFICNSTTFPIKRRDENLTWRQVISPKVSE